MENDKHSDLKKVLCDFLRDINVTYPELNSNVLHIKKLVDTDVEEVFEYCKTVYPERFFDILYENEEMFEDEERNTRFLPGLDINKLWLDDISGKTKDVIWKYLQLILFSVIGKIDNTDMFKDTSHLFEAIDEEKLKKKLEETINCMGDMFDLSKNMGDFANMGKDFGDLSGMGFGDIPDPNSIHEHLSDILGGKIGKLANEIAQETADELNFDMDGEGDMQDVFQNLFKNPGKLINMVKNVGKKIEDKIKSGEIKESELMEEATKMMSKMKKMPGMKNFQKMFGEMGLPTNGNFNMGHFKSSMNNNIKLSKQKERMLEKLKKKREMLAKQQSELKKEEDFVHKVFRDGEKMQKSTRPNKKKKKKKKKKKNKK
jgi:hypothetical protein